jgi:hypothetical protein
MTGPGGEKIAPSNALTDALTDGTGLSKLTGSKVLKDLVVDFLLTLTSTFSVANILSVTDAIGAPQQVEIAVGGALIRVLYRALMRWGTSAAPVA